jgi:superfamily I DNA/RNA helicase
MILVYRCIHLAKMIHKPILVLCYNRTLAGKLQEVAVEQGVSEKVTVRNFHAWCRDQLKYYHVELPTENSSEYSEELVKRLTHALDRGQVPRGQYGAVLIDEGHDFQADWLRIAVQMVDPTTESLLLLYDDAQSIYEHGRRGFSFKSVGIQAQGRTTILRLNYRNTAEVLKVAYEFAKDFMTPADADDDGIPLILPESADRHGPTPELVRLSSLAQETDYLARRLSDLHRDGIAWGDMAVLYRNHFIGEHLAQGLQAAGVPVAWLKKGERAKGNVADPNTVKVVTFHSSKGLEYPVVAIAGLGYLPDKREEEVQEVRLAYVAMTRAMNRLVMTCHRDSPFVRRLVAAGIKLAT